MMKRLWRIFRDHRDERRATRLRADLGHRGWLVSWRRSRPSGRWTARLSCSGFPETIERHGPSRCRAIERAAKALGELLAEV